MNNKGVTCAGEGCKGSKPLLTLMTVGLLSQKTMFTRTLAQSDNRKLLAHRLFTCQVVFSNKPKVCIWIKTSLKYQLVLIVEGQHEVFQTNKKIAKNLRTK